MAKKQINIEKAKKQIVKVGKLLELIQEIQKEVEKINNEE